MVPLGRYVQMFVPIIMYGLGLFFDIKTESTMFTTFKIIIMTLHVRLTNYTSLKNFMV